MYAWIDVPTREDDFPDEEVTLNLRDALASICANEPVEVFA